VFSDNLKYTDGTRCTVTVKTFYEATPNARVCLRHTLEVLDLDTDLYPLFSIFKEEGILALEFDFSYGPSYDLNATYDRLVLRSGEGAIWLPYIESGDLVDNKLMIVMAPSEGVFPDFVNGGNILPTITTNVGDFFLWMTDRRCLHPRTD